MAQLYQVLSLLHSKVSFSLLQWCCFNNCKNKLVTWLPCVGQPVLTIIATPSFSKSSVVKMFFVHTKTKTRRFQLPLVWRAFSKSSVFVTNRYGRQVNRRNKVAFSNFHGVVWTGLGRFKSHLVISPTPSPSKSYVTLDNTSFPLQVVTVHWLAFRGQPRGGAAGIVEIPFWTSGTSHLHIPFPSVCGFTSLEIQENSCILFKAIVMYGLEAE